jgi:microcystin degradation protein MlrC
MKTLRIAYARIAQETNVLSPLLTEVSDFERSHYLVEEVLAQACSKDQYEARGFVKNAELSGFVQEISQYTFIELIPIFSAWAVPSGQLSLACIKTLSQRLLEGIKKHAPIDGLYLSLHGAMRAEDQVDPDGDLLAMMREVLGDEIPLVASLDLHAVLTNHKVNHADLLVGYRTNPHRDHKKVGQNCARFLIQLLQNKYAFDPPIIHPISMKPTLVKNEPINPTASHAHFRPYVAWRSLPMVLGGGTTLDFLPPMRAIFKRMKTMEQHPHIISVSIYMCQPWHDHPDLGWASYVASNTDKDLAEQYADELADLLWQVRTLQPPSFTPVIEAIAKARKAWWARRSGAVFFADTSDVVMAGAPGNNTIIIQSLIEHAQGLQSFVAIRDPILIDQLQNKNIGDSIETSLGGHLTPQLYPAIPICGLLKFKGESPGFGQALVIQQGSIHICVTQASPGVMKADFYHQLGLNVWKADIVVVKNFFPWRLFCALYNRKSIYVQTKGITDLTAAHTLKFSRDLYPFQPVEQWRI